MNHALEKRVRRHVVGKQRDFFSVTAPGIEPLCLRELAGLGLAGEATTGGVEFRGRLHECFLANLHLRTAGRILMRIHAFRATAFSALEREALRFPWELFLPPGASPRLRVSTRRCRLHHTGAIAERVLRGLRERLGPAAEGLPGDAHPLQQVFIRGADDRFVVSIDSSGANLYLRGVKTHGGKAPVRETLAAAALMWCGYDADEALVDPMCGAGTFSLEAALWAKRIPPGWFRGFAFTGWPAFSGPRWAHMKRAAADGFVTLSAARIFASDIDAEACNALDACLRAKGLADAATVSRGDFFDLDPAKFADRPGLVVINPPYGRRLAGTTPRAGMMNKILERVRTAYRGWKLLLLVPGAVAPPAFSFPVRTLPFSHGGLTIRLITGRVP